MSDEPAARSVEEALGFPLPDYPIRTGGSENEAVTWADSFVDGIPVCADPGGSFVLALIQANRVSYELRLRAGRALAVVGHDVFDDALTVQELCRRAHQARKVANLAPWVIQYSEYIEDICAQCLLSDKSTAHITVSSDGRVAVVALQQSAG